MKRRLPPLNQLRAFEAAARHSSFRNAADELNVTHAAVSQQIRALEEVLGVQLFQRMTRGVKLTENARDLALELESSFNAIDRAVGRLRSNELTGKLKISVVPWWANHWLLPKLDEFHQTNHGLELEFAFSYGLVDFERDDFDAALRHGLGKWENLTSVQLHNDIVSPICRPELVEGKKLPLDPNEIARLPLASVRGDNQLWLDWLNEAGADEITNCNFLDFENQALAIEYARAGHGVGLSDIQSTADDIDASELILLHPHRMKLLPGMHLVYPKTPVLDPRLKVVGDWVKSTVAAAPNF